jgi:outer membrane autotransporter protein
MDRISANIYGEHAGNINVKGMNLLSDANQEITSILFADNGLKDNVIYAGNELPHEGYQTSFYTPIYKYNAVYDNKDDGGYFVFTKGDKIYVPTPGGTAGGGIISSGNSSDAFNPAVLGGSTSSIVGVVGTINQTVNNSFHSVDTFMNLPSFDRLAIKNQNKYAFNMGDDTMNLGKFSPLYQAQDEEHGIWVRPYATFESVPLKNGPKVSNIAYGTLVGFDTGLKELKNGWDRVWTGYLGYNGASQHFSGVDSIQNGGLLGGTLSLYRGNFFNATTLTVGANVAENQTMYGRDSLTMLMSGIANKCGYNFEFKDGKFILQPSVVLGYSFINTFDYTNAAGVKIDNKPTNYIQIAPGVKFIGNLKNGWQPYASVNMVWNLMGETNSTANGIKLPEMSIKPYVQYGVGVQKRIKDKFTAYTQAMVHNGGRNGVALTFGFKWTLGGNDKKKSEK